MTSPTVVLTAFILKLWPRSCVQLMLTQRKFILLHHACASSHMISHTFFEFSRVSRIRLRFTGLLDPGVSMIIVPCAYPQHPVITRCRRFGEAGPRHGCLALHSALKDLWLSSVWQQGERRARAGRYTSTIQENKQASRGNQRVVHKTFFLWITSRARGTAPPHSSPQSAR